MLTKKAAAARAIDALGLFTVEDVVEVAREDHGVPLAHRYARTIIADLVEVGEVVHTDRMLRDHTGRLTRAVYCYRGAGT